MTARKSPRPKAGRIKEKTGRKRTAAGTILLILAVLIAVPVLFLAVPHTAVVAFGSSRILDLAYDGGEITGGLPDEKADCILILGAGVWGDSPSPMLRERLEAGAALYRAGAAGKILVTGDNGSLDYNEVQVMEDYLAEELGVSRSDIVRDHAGFSTYESMYRAKEIFCVESAVIVTQKYHLFRAAYIASRLGIRAYGADAEKTAYSGKEGREIRECLARIKDFYFCILKPLPKYLGEKIPIDG